MLCRAHRIGKGSFTQFSRYGNLNAILSSLVPVSNHILSIIRQVVKSTWGPLPPRPNNAEYSSSCQAGQGVNGHFFYWAFLVVLSLQTGDPNNPKDLGE